MKKHFVCFLAALAAIVMFVGSAAAQPPAGASTAMPAATSADPDAGVSDSDAGAPAGDAGAPAGDAGAPASTAGQPQAGTAAPASGKCGEDMQECIKAVLPPPPKPIRLICGDGTEGVDRKTGHCKCPAGTVLMTGRFSGPSKVEHCMPNIEWHTYQKDQLTQLEQRVERLAELRKSADGKLQQEIDALIAWLNLQLMQNNVEHLRFDFLISQLDSRIAEIRARLDDVEHEVRLHQLELLIGVEGDISVPDGESGVAFSGGVTAGLVQNFTDRVGAGVFVTVGARNSATNGTNGRIKGEIGPVITLDDEGHHRIMPGLVATQEWKADGVNPGGGVGPGVRTLHCWGGFCVSPFVQVPIGPRTGREPEQGKPFRSDYRAQPEAGVNLFFHHEFGQ